jgi:Tol biopolymer transport system component
MVADTGRTRRKHSHPIIIEPHFSGPRWLPDGEAIGFIASREKEETLVIIDPDGGMSVRRCRA